MTSYKFIGITLLNVCINLLNKGPLTADLNFIEKEKINNTMDIESYGADEGLSATNNETPKKEEKKSNKHFVM